uniref:Cation/H+ exchanger domain-containing protein n=1 Tax=Oncorhynchus mykiss TaxID=8022 RepID=A0A8C7SL15_ONCMY
IPEIEFGLGLFFLYYRLVTVIALSPFLVRTGYGFSWRWAAVCVWGGTKGAFCLSLTLMAFQSDDLDEEQVREKILVLSSGMVVLTLLINAYIMYLVFPGLYDVSVPRRMAMYSAVQRVRESSQNTFSLLKIDRFLADANWEMNIINFLAHREGTIDFGECNVFSMKLTDESLRVQNEWCLNWKLMLVSYQTSYWKQYSAGMLNREAARTLINTAENMTDHKGKFMSVQDVKKYWELKGFFVSLRRSLEDWLYNVKLDKLKPSRNAMLKRCYQVVFSLPFEYFIYALIVLNIFPIILEFIPAISDKHNLELSIINYIFFSGYLVEAILKVGHRPKLKYIAGVPNILYTQCRFDIALQHIFLRLSIQLHLIIIPKLIEIINRQIHKQLSFGYDIGKGYVIGEEHISKIIDHISDDKTYAQCAKFTTDRSVTEDTVWDLFSGLLQRDHPEIAISVKTRQAIRAVLNSERDAIHTLVSGGLLDDIEASKLEKVLSVCSSCHLQCKRPKEKTRLTDYRSCGAIMGELNCLTQQSMEMTVTCETATQTVPKSFEQNPFPSQGWSYHRICSHLARAYLVDVEVNRKFDVYDGTMEDVVVIYGSCDDLASQCSYNAPALISRTTHQYNDQRRCLYKYCK